MIRLIIRIFCKRGSAMAKTFYGDDTRPEIDHRINRYTLRCLRIILLAMVLVWILNELHIFIINETLLSHGFLIACIIIGGALIFGRFADLRQSWAKYVLILFTITAITILGICMTYHAVLLSMLPLLIATQYTNRRVLHYSYVLTIISTFVIVMGGYFFGLCDANMLLLTTDPTSHYLNMLQNGRYFESYNLHPWLTLPLYFAFPRCILLTLAIPIIQKITENIHYYESYYTNVRHLSERDEMTGLYNRNKYLNMIEETYPAIDQVGVIFWDVNNLKATNDTLGHDKGDALIINTASIIMALTAANRKAYRVGGDEFVMIVENPQKGELDAVVRKWEELCSLKSQALELDLASAVGYSCGDGKAIKSVIKEADQAMYLDKQQKKSRAVHS